jgi:hypothetical protein
MKKKNRIPKNPYLLFLPFLIVFIIYVLIFPTNGHQGDESRYIMFARNLLNGFYSPPPPNINLTNGPGFPIILMPFLALHLPLISITIMNAVFYYFSVIFLYKALEQVVSLTITLIFSLFWACYYISYQNMPFVHTEIFTYLLISMLIFFLIKAFKPETSGNVKRNIFCAGFILGFIVLTKIAFVYVFLVMLIGSSVLWIYNKEKINYYKGFIIMVIAFATVLPYMIYTYNLTGRMFYWNTNTGVTLYWSTNPYKDEYGDWKQDLDENTVDMGNYNIPGAEDTLIAHHARDYYSIFKNKKFTQFGMAQDDAFKKFALDNIKVHPLKYLQNCVLNVGRLIFQYPFSYAVQRPKVLLVFPINGIIFTLILFCLIPTFRNWRNIIYPVRFMLIFAFLYLGLSSMVTAYVRMFSIIVPVLLFWFAFIFENTTQINLKFENSNN